MAPDVWGAGGLRAAVRRQSWRKRVGTPAACQAVRHAVRQRRMAMPLRWKTSGLLGSRRANAATNRQSAANRALISRLLGVNRPFIGCEGARQRFTQVAEPFADPFLLGDVTVTYDHVQPRLARRPPRARLRGGASHEAEGRRGARGGGAGRVRARGACACCAREATS